MDPRRVATGVAASIGGPVLAATELAGGTVNHVFRVRTAGRDLVVRIPRDVVRNGDPFEVEAWALGAARAAGLPTPRLVARGERDGRPYLVTEHVEGVAPSGDPGVWHSIGALAVRLAAIDVRTAPNGLFSRFGRDLDAAWAAHLEYHRTALGPGDALADLGVYAPADATGLRAAVDRLAARPLPQGLVHGDLAPRNLLAAPDGLVLLDWGNASTGPATFGDLDRINRWRLLDDPASPVSPEGWRAVLAGAGLVPAAAQPVLDDIAAVHALDVVRWALDRRPARVPELVDESRRLLAALSTRAAGP